MKIKQPSIFFNNLDYLYSLVKAAGVNKKKAAEMIGIHRSTEGKWKTRNAIDDKHLRKLVIFFDKYTDFPLTEELLLSKNLARMESRVGEAAPLYLSVEEKALIRRLRKWKIVNREAIIKFIMEAHF